MFKMAGPEHILEASSRFTLPCLISLSLDPGPCLQMQAFASSSLSSGSCVLSFPGHSLGFYTRSLELLFHAEQKPL